MLRIFRFHANSKKDGHRFRLGAVKIGTLVARRRRVDICCLKEVQYKNLESNVFNNIEEKYKFWFCGNKSGTNRVGQMIKKELAYHIPEIERHSDNDDQSCFVSSFSKSSQCMLDRWEDLRKK